MESISTGCRGHFRFGLLALIRMVRQSVLNKFDHWAESGRGDAMAEGHWPRTRQIIQRMGLAPDMAVLDVGCGNGYGVRAMLDEIGSGGRGVGVDISPAMVALAQKHSDNYPNARFETISSESMPFETGTFHRVLSVEVIYYAADLHRFLQEIHRVLKPGGSLWVMLDYYEENPYSKNWAELLGFSLHRLSEQAYQDAFLKAGFHSVEMARLLDERPLDETEASFKPGWGFETLEDIKTFRTSIGSLLVSAIKL